MSTSPASIPGPSFAASIMRAARSSPACTSGIPRSGNTETSVTTLTLHAGDTNAAMGLVDLVDVDKQYRYLLGNCGIGEGTPVQAANVFDLLHQRHHFLLRSLVVAADDYVPLHRLVYFLEGFGVQVVKPAHNLGVRQDRL